MTPLDIKRPKNYRKAWRKGFDPKEHQMKRTDFIIRDDGTFEWRVNEELLDQIRDGLQILRDRLSTEVIITEVMLTDDGRNYEEPMELKIVLHPKETVN